MCGIAGFTFANTASRDHHAIITDMLQSIAHRGPDEQDVATRDGIVLGHNRLTIMEPSGGHQPRVHEASGNTLIFNGEVYNHRAFDADIEASGGELRDHCDTETLFWLLELYGIEKTLSLIDGMFAFAWYQRSSETLYLARDRFGQKPLFYSQTGEEFVFASEIKALRRHPTLANTTPDIPALRLYLMMEYVPGPATGIRGIHEVPAGHVLALRGNEHNVSPYWQPGNVIRKADIDTETATRKLDELLNTAVRQQLVADVPVGVFLSGGLDSSIIAAIAKRHTPDVATFTVKFPYASFNESSHAESVAAHIGSRHTTVELDQQNCVDGIEHLLSQTDQPFADSSMLPSFLLSRATKQYVTVALGGDGADELFFGYPNFKLLHAARMMAAMPGGVGRALRAVARVMPDSSAYMNRAFLLRQLSYGIGKPANRQSIYWMAAIPPFAQVGIWRDAAGAQADIAQALAPQFPADADLSLLEQCQRQFISAYLADDILQKMDRASMYASLEVRNPYLSTAVSDYALSLPTQTLFKGITGKRILRSLASTYLQQHTITRRKHGFGLPVSALLRSDLRELAEAVLLDASNSMYQYIEFETVSGWWAQHTSNKRDRGKALWALLMLAGFFRNQF